MKPGLPRFSRSSASVYYTERKLKNKKTGEAWERGYGYVVCFITYNSGNRAPQVLVACEQAVFSVAQSSELQVATFHEICTYDYSHMQLHVICSYYHMLM